MGGATLATGGLTVRADPAGLAVGTGLATFADRLHRGGGSGSIAVLAPAVLAERRLERDPCALIRAPFLRRALPHALDVREVEALRGYMGN